MSASPERRVSGNEWFHEFVQDSCHPGKSKCACGLERIEDTPHHGAVAYFFGPKLIVHHEQCKRALG